MSRQVHICTEKLYEYRYGGQILTSSSPDSQEPVGCLNTGTGMLTVVSMFAGCGGLDLGFVGGFEFGGERVPALPFRIIAAYDNNERAIQTYKENIAEHAEVADLAIASTSTLPAADVLIGGFPCQDFASCGPRLGLTSARGQLYMVMTDYARHHQPKMILGENVPGLENIDGGNALRQIVHDVEAEGYRVQIWKLYAPDYGVPQRRTRLFIVAVREDLRGFPERPSPTYAFAHRSIRWAIEDLESVEDETIPNQSQYFRASRAKRGNGQGDEVSDAEMPAYTVRANAKSRVQFHYNLPRRLTVREVARLQTFPDTFVFPHAATTNVMQIGNAVPPLLANRVASSIWQYLCQSGETSVQADRRRTNDE